MDFQKVYARIRDIDQGKQTINESVVECGEMPMPVTPPAAPPVTMSVNFNAQGIDHIKELLGLMQASEGPLAAGPVGAPEPMAMPTPGMPAGLPAPTDNLGDIAKLAGLAPKPAIADSNPEDEAAGDDLGDLEGDIAGMNAADAEAPEAGDDAEQAEPGTGDMMQDIAGEIKDMADELAGEEGDEGEEEEETEEGAYDASTTPNPEYQDTNYMIKDLAGGLNKEKKMYKHSYKQGDNPMSIEDSVREELTRLYNEFRNK